MTEVNIKGTFAKDQKPFNGLSEISKELVKRSPKARMATYAVVAIVRSVGSKWDAESGVETPKIAFDHIEVASDPADDKTVRAMLDAYYNARVGEERPETLFEDGDGEPDDGAELT